MADPVKGGLRRFVRSIVSASPEVDFAACYGGTVAAQNSDGTIDVKMNDPRIPGMQRLRMRWGPAGVISQVQQGVAVLVGWEGANPAKPYVAAMQASGATTVLLGVSDEAGADVTEKALLGSTYRQNEKQLHSDLAGKFAQLAIDLGTMTTAQGPVAAVNAIATVTAIQTIFTQYEAQAASRGDDLSNRVKLK